MSLNSSHHSYLHLQVTENDSWVKIWHQVDGATLGGPYPVFLSSTVALKGEGGGGCRKLRLLGMKDFCIVLGPVLADGV